MTNHKNIPTELTHLKQWCCFKAIPDENRPGKIKKLPINPNSGRPAASNDPGTWVSYNDAAQAESYYDGLGFMFGGGYFGVDIDGVPDALADYRNGDYDNIIAEFIETLQTYAEISLSGNGIHLICKGSLPEGGRRKGNVEMYQSGRFFVMTGNLIGSHREIAECTQPIKPLYAKYIGMGQPPTTGIIPLPEHIALSDEEVIEKAANSARGEMFADLLAGNWNKYFGSQSEADLSLCSQLAFWTGRDSAQIDRIFRTTGLMRPKWDRKQAGTTYGQLTVKRACSNCENVYTPKAEYIVTIGKREEKPFVMQSFDDTGNAARFVLDFGSKMRYHFIAKKWMYYNGRYWEYDLNGQARRLADEVVEEMRHELPKILDHAPYSADPDDLKKDFAKHLKYSRSSKAKAAMLREAEHRLPVMPDALDRDDMLLCAANGILDLHTGELKPHNPEKYMTKTVLCEYTDKMDAPRWEQFLSEIFCGDKDLIHYIQKAVGYSLTGRTDEQCMFICFGNGKNGKSTFLDTLCTLMHEYAVNVQPETIVMKSVAGPTGDIARLAGSRFARTSEFGEGVRLNEGLVKQLTGGQTVTAAKKYENEFEFSPKFKLWMDTNPLPIIRGTDNGIWRRLCCIPFSATISNPDKRLKYKLQRELPAILKWAVDGALLWQKEGLEMPKRVYEAGKQYRSEMDVIAGFLAECTHPAQYARTPAKEAYSAYQRWARENNEYCMSGTKFGIEMGKRFGKEHGRSSWVYIGFSLREDYTPYTVEFRKA